ncbi:hypothetical protein M011DRAFT_463492 [Sporormia fimetaria CBS 119925]|uniref:DUF6594 domain-containing protein n=1 Tax=Sporormia fimetaria CBS 119925 TaxID=1340428 RepID=A0A6A6VS00_9PLEO|nr:hypothetical protein M011DRAFT_463492 [Sporormia fimetaria CBS 119925]
MGPARTMTGETYVNEKQPPQTPICPTSSATPVSPTHTDTDTLRGDAIIEILEDDNSTLHRSPTSTSGTSSSVGLPPAPCGDEKPPTLLRRITGPFKSIPEPPDVVETRTRTLENTPNGFPRLAAFQASEANFSLYRSFNYLHSRVLLDLQDDITCLEKELDDLDWDDFEEDPNRLRSRETDVAAAETDAPNARNRRVVLTEIRNKLMQYDEVLIKARTLESFQKPSDRNYRSVRRYHHNTKPLQDSEMDAIRSKEDIVSLRNGREWASFDGGVETMISQIDHFLQKLFRLRSPPLQRYFRTPELRAKTTNQFISLYSSSRIDLLVNIMITFVIFVLLVIPVVAMYLLTSEMQEGQQEGNGNGKSGSVSSRDTFNAVGVLIVFTLLFSAAMSLVTKAARHELFAASAAYCAILVVFIGNLVVP